ncbi:MAG TPA: tetratricopeptide repeat protein [Candidatus Acidoferrales bacterium]|jgi:tetratricopeptide (TPR) repeat protein|nr:tetratricopeptide repeat protein [Candidatus Acidoferrales bacterium]
MKKSVQMAVMVLAGGMLLSGARISAQYTQQPAPTLNPEKKQDKPQEVTPLTLDNAPPPVNAEEDAAIHAFRSAPISDMAKKDQLGEEFLQKYPQSRYRSEVYALLVRGYLSLGQVDKMETAGDKEIELNPTDAQTLAIVGSTLPRVMSATTPEPQKRLDKAEQYSKKALEVLPTLVKPAELSDADFLKAKDQTSALAYSGLGLVAFRKSRFAEAIPNFEQAVKLDPTPDPVNFYLLGIANEKTSHFDDAATAFTKCAAVPGGLQATCKSSADEARKMATTQLSAPK